MDPCDYFKTSNSTFKTSDTAMSPYPPRMPNLTPGKACTVLSDSKTNLHYDSLSSENMDPSHDRSAPLMTSTVLSKPGPNLNSRSSMDSDMPAQPNGVNREHSRSRVGRNLLGATASNSPLTPR